MNRILNISTLILLSIFAVFSAKADIIENLNRPGSSITVEQPEQLAKRLSVPDATEVENQSAEGEQVQEEKETQERPVQMSRGKIVGYRVQVYADNNVRVAKGEARQRERAISSRFPYATYVAYVSPYWRLRVGDFKTQAEAEKAAADIRRTFPGYAKEIRIVRDRINAK